MMQYPGTNFHDLNLDWILDQVKNCLAEWATTKTEWESTEAQVNDALDYINNYFANLDVTQEVRNKLDDMAESGELLSIIAPQVAASSQQATADWLDQHETTAGESVVVIDDTLSIPRAAAEASTTGEKVNAVTNTANALDVAVFGTPQFVAKTLFEDKYFNMANVFANGETTYFKSESGYSTLSGTYCTRIEVQPGQKYKIVGVGYSNTVGLYILTDSDNNVIDKEKIGDRSEPVVITTSAAGVLYVNLYGYDSTTDGVYQGMIDDGLVVDVADIQEDMQDLVGVSHTEERTETLVENKYFNTYTVFHDASTTYVKQETGYATREGTNCKKITVRKGETYRITGIGLSDTIGLCVFTNYNGSVIFTNRLGSRTTPVILQATVDGYLYVNLADYNSATDSVKCITTVYTQEGTEQIANKLVGCHSLFGKKVVNFGDSIFGNKRPPFDVSTALSELTGATVYNGGFGGCRMAQHSNSDYDPFSMYQLAYAIVNNSWTLQDAADFSALPAYFPETLAMLKAIDFSDVSAITIAYGTNDLAGSVVIDNTDNPVDTTTFCGALRYSLNLLMAAFPQLHVFVCTPTWRCWLSGGEVTETSDDFVNSRGNTMAEFITAEETVCSAYHVQQIDNYNIGINTLNRLHWFPANDGTHHNREGGILIAQNMATKIY